MLDTSLNLIDNGNLRRGGGFRPKILENLILRYELKGKARKFQGWFWVHAQNVANVRPQIFATNLAKLWPKWAQKFNCSY